jgi:hypothetical protein
MPGEDLALPVERQVIAIFGHQDMREQSGAGQTLCDRPFGSRCLMDGTASPTAIARPADADDTKSCRNKVEHLADGIANGMQRPRAAGTRPLLDVDPHVLADEMRRQARPIDLAPGLAPFCSGRQRRFDVGNIDTEVFEAELQLLVIKPLGAPAELLRCSLRIMSRNRSISASAALRLVRSAASVRTIRCSVATSSGRAARSMSMRAQSS